MYKYKRMEYRFVILYVLIKNNNITNCIICKIEKKKFFFCSRFELNEAKQKNSPQKNNFLFPKHEFKCKKKF